MSMIKIARARMVSAPTDLSMLKNTKVACLRIDGNLFFRKFLFEKDVKAFTFFADKLKKIASLDVHYIHNQTDIYQRRAKTIQHGYVINIVQILKELNLPYPTNNLRFKKKKVIRFKIIRSKIYLNYKDLIDNKIIKKKHATYHKVTKITEKPTSNGHDFLKFQTN